MAEKDEYGDQHGPSRQELLNEVQGWRGRGKGKGKGKERKGHGLGGTT
jgi:hypothetical protein